MDDQEIMQLFGNRVTLARERKQLSPQVLGKEAKTSYQTIWRIEKGMHNDVSMLLVRRIARVLGVSTDYLMGIWEDPNRQAGADPDANEHSTGSTTNASDKALVAGV